MFEKEAERYADKNETRGGGSAFGDETNYHDLRQAFKDGAEFGYSKAFAEADKNLKAMVADFNKAKEELRKENAELKKQVLYLKDNLRVARKDRENLRLEVGKGLQEFIKDCPYTSLKLYANEKYVEENAELKEQIEKMKCCSNCEKMGYNSSFAPICKVMNDSKIENPLGIKCNKWELAN